MAYGLFPHLKIHQHTQSLFTVQVLIEAILGQHSRQTLLFYFEHADVLQGYKCNKLSILEQSRP